MAEKLNASVCVLESILNGSVKAKETVTKKKIAKPERSVSLQFPEDFFQEPLKNLVQHQLSETRIADHKKMNECANDANPIALVHPHFKKQCIATAQAMSEHQTKLNQCIMNFKQFKCSLKPLLAMLEFVLQDVSGC
jgi:hypothetical protein